MGGGRAPLSPRRGGAPPPRALAPPRGPDRPASPDGNPGTVPNPPPAGHHADPDTPGLPVTDGADAGPTPTPCPNRQSRPTAGCPHSQLPTHTLRHQPIHRRYVY